MLCMGIDCGTQSLKVVIWSPSRGVVATASQRYTLMDGLLPGHKEQDPQVWLDALEACVTRLAAEGVALDGVGAIGVSGQQHGLVVLDDAHVVVRPAKLWNDTSTAAQCETIIANAGGLLAWAEAVGQFLPPGYTASKVLWLKEHEPAHYARARHLCLPHDYLNLYLTGALVAEAGDASGTGYFDVRGRTWSQQALGWIDPDRDLEAMLPPLIGSDRACGTLRPALAAKWGLGAQVTVSSGGGDNMMGAIGTGNVKEGIVTASLGTSGTIYGFRESPGLDPELEVSSFCDSTGAWLPLASTLGTTVGTEMVRRKLMGVSLSAFEASVAEVPAGCGGLLMLPYYEGERTPNLPDGTGVLIGLQPSTCTPGHLARAAMEGAIFGLRYCQQALARVGVEATEVRLIGGGARSEAWRQICADVFGVPIIAPRVQEGPGFGAALQAWWSTSGEPLSSVVEAHVAFDEGTRATPRPENVALYAESYRLWSLAMEALVEGRVFERHRRWVTGQNLRAGAR